VPNRKNVLFHVLDYTCQNNNCVGVGESYGDTNIDGVLDLINQRKTLDVLLSYLDDEFVIVVL